MSFKYLPPFIILHLLSCNNKETYHKPYYTEYQFFTESSNEDVSLKDDMINIEGNYCPKTDELCLQWVDSNNNKTSAPVNTSGRCGVWRSPVKCLTKTIYKHYKIDRYEFPNIKGSIPKDWMSWFDSKNACESIGKRLCTRSEWTFAAQGTDMHPVPYGDGFHRSASICNFDNLNNGIDVFKATNKNSENALKLHNMLMPSGSKEQCVSDWGVHDMAGNIDEFVVNETGKPYISGMMGGHIFGVRNASTPMTDAHGPDFSWYESGTRCCKDAK